MARALLGLVLLLQASAADVGSDSDPPPVDDVPASTVTADPTPVPEVEYAQSAWPFGGSFAQRLWCIESHESGHDPAAVNPRSKARGLLQWLPSTAQAWGVMVGSRTSEWSAAAAIHAVSETYFRSQWPVTARLCP